MDTEPQQTPQYEPGGGKLLVIAAVLVGLGLAGIAFSFLSRQSAPPDAPGIKSRHLPPSEKPAEKPAEAPANTPSPAQGK